MSRRPFTLSIPVAELRRFVDRARASGEPLEDGDAIADLQVTADEGRIHGQRTYAKRWGWTYPTVRYRWAELTAEAANRATSYGSQPGNPAARHIPADWLVNAGLEVPDSAKMALESSEKADSPRTAHAPGGDGAVTAQPQRTDSAEIGAGEVYRAIHSAATAQSHRTDSADLPSLIPHLPILTERTDRPRHVPARDGDAEAGSVGPLKGSGTVDVGAIADKTRIIAALRQLGETDDHLEEKVDALYAAHPSHVLPVLADLQHQAPGSVRSPFGWLSVQVRRASQGQHRPASVAAGSDPRAAAATAFLTGAAFSRPIPRRGAWGPDYGDD